MKNKQNNKGQALVEYGLVLALVTLVVVVVLGTTGAELKSFINLLNGRIDQSNKLSQSEST